MGNERLSAALAIGMGVLIGALVFVPFVAVSYRRRGRLTIGRTALWSGALVYFFAIWTYTLFPLPDPDTLVCAGTNTDLWQAVRDLEDAAARGLSLTDPMVAQLVLNVALFVPLGFFVRVLGGRGWPTALIAGLATSVFVETTQYTGLWGLYDCGYRVFDVDDMVTNTAGAIVGSLLALAIPARRRGLRALPDADLPRPVTKRRRLLGAMCDLLGALVLGAVVSVIVQLWLEYVRDDHEAVVRGTVAAVAGTVVPFAVWAAAVLVTGRTIGDLAVELEYRGGSAPEPLARVARLLGGVGGFLLLNALPGEWKALSFVFAVLAAALIATTRQGRGLPGVLTGRQLCDARADRRTTVAVSD
ncbi:MAG: VanZ family protein [Gordonia sp. (in: high G+C Gram-positive bacteria)]|uniref:VanZ family protein n=1 Tax=Gordonia TaxID=2053 RepID=UPI003263FA00